jgi:cation transport regulator ChaB
MRYESIEDLPFVCRYNLPEAALAVYRSAYNRAWEEAGDVRDRDRAAQQAAWRVVRDRFVRDPATRQWVDARSTWGRLPAGR